MAYDLSDKLVVAISSRALFDLEYENTIFEKEGIEAYTRYQIENENTVLAKGTAFPLVEALLGLNEKFEEPIVEVIILSSNSPETALRVFNSIAEYKLDIVRGAFTGGEAKHPYLGAFNIDLFLSRNEKEVQDAIDQLQQHLFMILQEITTLIKKKSVLHSMQMLLFSRMNRS